MANKEQGKSKEKKVEQAPQQNGSQKEAAPTAGFLTEFFAQLKLNKFMQDATRGTARMNTLAAIEEDLASNDARVKQSAFERIEELSKIKSNAEVKAQPLNAGQLVANVEIPERLKERIEQVAATIDDGFSKIEKGVIKDEELVVLNAQLELLAVGLGVEVTPKEMEGLSSKLKYLEELAKNRQNLEIKGVSISGLNLYLDEFKPGVEGEVLRVRVAGKKGKQAAADKLEEYKKHVKTELLSGDRKALEVLTGEELLKRLEEATYWRENEKLLFGDSNSGKHRGYWAQDQLEDVLIGVEAQYTVELERRMEKGPNGNGVSGEFVRLATQKVLKEKKSGRSQYNFEKNKQKGKTSYETLKMEIDATGKKMEKAAEKKSKVVMTSREGTYSGTIEGRAEFHSVEEVASSIKGKGESQEAKMQFINDLESRLGIDFNDIDFLETLEDPRQIERLIREARGSGKLSATELTEYKKVLESIGSRVPGLMGAEGGRFTGVQKELVKLSKEAHKSGNYAPYMIKLQAYIDRVGLRETSSDFQFAIVMRQAKDEISKLNQDAGGKFDLWQEAQFLPAITALDEKTYYSISPKVVNQLRMKLEIEGPFANWLAMQVDGVDSSGKTGKRSLSVAAFYQMLQRKDVANRVITAPINGNDGMILDLWAEHVWGDGAKLDKEKMVVTLANGRVIRDINVSYFSMDNDPKADTKNKEYMSVKDFLDQSMWMAHYAEKMWWYSGEWEAFARDFPGERLPQANKRLLAIGSAFRDYGIEYGKFDVGYVELAKAGVLLQDFRTYKAGDVIVANMRHMLYDTKDERGLSIATAKEGETLGKGIFKALSSRATISEHYNPLSSLRPVEEIRLMGNLSAYTSPEARWNYFKKSQEKIGRKGVPSYSIIARIRSQSFENLQGEEEGWYIQAEQIDLLFEDLKKQRAELGKLNWTQGVLYHLMDKQSLVETGNHIKVGGETLDKFLQEFQYSSVLSYSELRKGTDPLDYQKYSEAKTEAAALMTEVLNGTPSLEKLNELFIKMKNYMPADQIVGWFEEFRRKQIQLRTWQSPLDKYDIAMTDLEEWEMKKKRGEETVEHPPANIIGYTPAYFSIKDDRGDKWNVVGADGFRVTRQHKIWGNHMKDTRDVPALTAAEIELQNKVYVGNRWLMKDTAEEILEDSFGMSKMVNRICKTMNWDEHSKGAKLIKKYGSKAILLLRKHPLFDDPVWAFWNILNEFNEFRIEVGKEMGKELVGGHH